MSTPSASSPSSSPRSSKSAPPSSYNAGEFEPHLSKDPKVRRLQILQICGKPGETFSSGEIAAFTNVSRQRVEQIEKRAILKLGRALLQRYPGLFSEVRDSRIAGASPA